ncbi:MAG: hypothetical protein GY940_08670, partial [bacterium]|nr:hypothetical protein [bacterium]
VKDITSLPYLRNLELITDTLGDIQQHSFWIQIKKRRTLRLEMLGRNLTNALLWRDGSWLEAIQPTITEYETIPGQPMTHIEFHHDLNPGLYLLTCYGGPPLTWAKENNKHPFFLRMGIPQSGQNGQQLMTISPFGRDTFTIDGQTNFFQLVRKDKKDTHLTLTRRSNTSSRFSSRYRTASITKKSRDPWCMIRSSAGNKNKKQWITITGTPGDPVELDFFLRRHYVEISRHGGQYWFSTIHSAQSRDAIDATALITYPTKQKPIIAKVINVPAGKPIIRKVNLLENITVFLFIEKSGTYVIEEDPKAGAKGRYQLVRFMTQKPKGYKAPPFQPAGTDFELTGGYYVLTIYPKSKGILHFALHEKTGWLSRTFGSLFSSKGKQFKKKQSHTGQSVVWPQVTIPSFSSHYHFTFRLNRQGGVDTGFIARKLPMKLLDPLPVPLEPGKSVVLKVKHKEKMNVIVTGGKYRLKVDNQPWNPTAGLSSGTHQMELENRDLKMRLYNVRTEVMTPYIPPPKPIIKKIEDIFPIITVQKTLFRDFDRTQTKSFLLQVDEPGLYRLETTGRMAMAITVRTRTSTSLYHAQQNGIGRNALIQQFLKPGDYLVQVQTIGQSKGRAGIVLRHTQLNTIDGLSQGVVKRNSLSPDAAIRYTLNISEPGDYYLNTYSLGKPLTFRLDDHHGWPLMVPGGRGPVKRHFDKGTYYYYSLPQPIESRRLTFLKRILQEPPISGKGPHWIQLNKSLENTWIQDPQGSPDIYRTTITAPINASLTINGQMQAGIFDEEGNQLAVTRRGTWSGPLPAGNYELIVKSPARDNHMPYTIRLHTPELIPGLAQTAFRLPARYDVSLGKHGLVEIASFGDRDVKAVLKDQEGKTIITHADDMPHDWNFKISRNLNAGRYILEVSPAMTRYNSQPVEIRMQQLKITKPTRQPAPKVSPTPPKYSKPSPPARQHPAFPTAFKLDEAQESPLRTIQPGETHYFRFVVPVESKVGVGLKAQSDNLDARLLDETSKLIATGPLIIETLKPGNYLLEVQARDVPVKYRPILLGNQGSRKGIPDEVIQRFKN